ncbi:MAG TPA: molybdenum cofactor guanylyltransferase [Polyangiales bacterium]|nr:molybdenum cofactor guanylyltransferase [Polyangiales bacterium]
MLAGIFVGGRATRMQGATKPLLPTREGEPLLTRTLRIARAAGLTPILIGSAKLGEAAEGIPQYADTEPLVGPLSGFATLLAHTHDASCIALAGDMPYISQALLQRLATESPAAAVLAPRDPLTGKWHPLFARYQSAVVRPALASALANGARSFQALFRTLSVVELAVSAAELETLHDWDRPEDMRHD